MPKVEVKKTQLELDINSAIKKSNYANLTAEERESYLLTEDGLKLIENMARANYSNVQMAMELKFTQVWLKNFSDEHAEFYDRIDYGRDQIAKDIENALIQRAKGYVTIETHRSVRTMGGRDIENVDTTEKTIPPDTMAIQYFMNNKKRYEYKKDQQPASLSEISGIKVVLSIDDGSGNGAE